MLKFLCLVSVLVVVESNYLGNLGLGNSGGGSSGYAAGLNNGGSYGIGNGGRGLGNSGYSYESISGGSNSFGGGANGGVAGNGAIGAVVGVSTIPAGPAHAIPTAFSTQSRFDIIHPGSIVQQTVSHVPVVSTENRPVAVAVGHHGHHHH